MSEPQPPAPGSVPVPAPTPVRRLDAPQRQSYWAVAFLAFRIIRQVGFVQLALFFGFVVARLQSLLALIAIVGVIGVVLFTVAALQWWRYTFVIEAGELVVRRGVLQQQTLSIPLGRVQSVSLEQKLLHRLISLVQITLDTAGADTAEFVIDAVDRPVAEELQRLVADYRASAIRTSDEADAADTPPAPETVLVKHGPRRVLHVALTQSPFAGLVLVAPLFAAGNELSDFIPFELPELQVEEAGLWLLWLIPLVVALGLAVSVVLNLVRVVLTDWGLTLHATADGFRRKAGLLSTTSVAAPIPRVQLVKLGQGVLERTASLHTVRLETIGVTNLVVPGCTLDQAQTIRRIALDNSPPVARLDQRVSPAAVYKATRNAAIVAAVLAGLLALLIGWWSALLFLIVPVVWATTRRHVRLRRWGASGEALAERRELLAWRRTDLLVRKINGVTLAQSLFERKRDLATLTFSTAAGALSIGMIPLVQAKWLRDEVLRSVETDRRAWM